VKNRLLFASATALALCGSLLCSAALGDPAPAAGTTPSVSTEKIRTTLRAYVDAWNAHDPRAIGDLYAPDAIQQKWGGCNPSGAQIARDAGDLLKMFPDLKTSLRRVFVKGNEAVVEVALLGTNTGPSPGPDNAPPTGRLFGEVGVRVIAFTPDGQIRDERDYFDLVTRKTQLDGDGPRVRAPIEAARQGSPSAANVPLDVYEAHGTAAEASNTATVVAMQGAYGAHDARRYGDSLAADVIWEDFMAPATLAGRGPQVDYFRLVMKTLPDVASNCDTWAAGDYVVEECSIVGTDSGHVDRNHKPTGDRISFHVLDVFEVRDGKVQKAWSYGNRMERSRQLGWILPARGERSGAAK
jgi:predicted ester cyclase